MDPEVNRYSYNRFGTKGARVGQAVMDILSKDQPQYTVEEILDEFGKDYLNLIRDLADKSKGLYHSPYYIFSILKKDLGHFGISNVLKHSARPFQLKVASKAAVEAHPGATKNLFEVDAIRGEINLMWTIPSNEECVSILKSPEQYDSELVNWIRKCFSGQLDQKANA